MPPALKHLDVATGVDTHIVMVPSPAGPIPTPIPHPFIGALFDPMDYMPKFGATVLINGMPRAHAGTAVKATPPHIPMGGPFMMPAGNEGQLFMGSSTVLVEGEPMGYAGLPVLTCQDIGMPAPLRPSKKTSARSLMLPASIAMAIPSGPAVLIGGAPIISMPGPGDLLAPALKQMASALKRSKRLAAGLSRVRTRLKGASRYLNQRADRVFERLGLRKDSIARNLVRRAICTVTGHPVDVATGKVLTDFVDLELPGPLPFKLERVWYSTSTYDGPLGHGWHASFDMALAEDEEVVGVRLADGRVALFPALEQGGSHFDPRERLTLHRDSRGYRVVEAATGLTYHFPSTPWMRDTRLAAIEDHNGFLIRFHHDRRGRLEQIVDSGSREWDMVYDAETGRLEQVHGPHPSEADQRVVFAKFAYDAWGNLAEVRDARGAPQKFVYKRHLLVQETNRNGLSFYFAWDGRDETARCVRTWGDSGIYDHKLTYDPARKLTTVENSLGFKTQYQHDGAMVTRVVDAFGNKRLTEYDADHRVTAEIDVLGQRTHNEHDERGNLTQSMGPDGATITLEYDANDLPVRMVDPMGGVWTWTRDERGRVLECKDPLERVTRYEYHQRWLVGVVNPAGGRTAIGYDRTGSVDAVATPDGAIRRFHYDLIGREIARVDPNGNVARRELDILGRVRRAHDPDGNVRTLTYDPEGNVVHAQDKHHDVRFTYQGMNRLASRSEAGTTVRFVYDTEEQLTEIVNEHHRAYRFVLGPTGEVDEEHGFDGLTRKYTRDQAGRVTRVDRPGERFSTYEYDPAGRVTKVEHSDGSSESYVYQLDGALSYASNDDHSVRFERDPLGRILEESQDGHTVESAYDLLGMRVRVRSSLGADQTIERNVMGDVLGVSEAESGFAARFTRDKLGLELERTLPGGVKSRWQRDKLGRPLEHVVRAEGSTLHACGYAWDVHDRLRAVTDGFKGFTEYRHDALGNLAWATYPNGEHELRMPDAVGNLFRTEHRGDRKYGPAGQLLVASTPRGDVHYAYDPEGDLIEKHEPDGRTWRYEWNGSGMLAKVTRPDGSAVTFTYDPLGRRVSKSYRGQTTRWVWDGNVPLHEWVEGKLLPLSEAGGVPFAADDASLLKREAELEDLLAQGPPLRGCRQAPLTWLFEPESFAPMARICGGQHHAIVCDHLGTPVLLVNDEGRPAWSANVGVYGELRDLNGERWACPFRWPGQYEDLETGLYYNRFRYYDPQVGQYASQDPIGLLGGLAQYGYVHDPNVWTDIFGLAKRAGCDSGRLDTSRAARREVMRKQGIPTSQQPLSQSRNASGREYRYEVAVTGGRREIKSVQQQTMDRSHPGQGHWEAGTVKVDDWGTVRMNDYGRPKLASDKSKVDYDE